MGAQPLLFGLKPNGYPGDRSLNPSLEYLSGVSGQAAPAVIGDYSLSDLMNFRFGVFDQASAGIDNNGDLEGSSISDNIFLQLTLKSGEGDGIYGNFGYESAYSSSTNSSEPIIVFGAGFNSDTIDLSFEYISLDIAFGEEADRDDETIMVVELGFQVNDDNMAYVDVSRADEADYDTLRVGLNHQTNNHTTLSAELARDSDGDTDYDSLDLRVAFSY